jgi:hypothetical protein
MKTGLAFFLGLAVLLQFPNTAGASVTIGGLTYSIGVVTRASTFGPEFMQEHAAGEYLVVPLTIRNVGKDPATISGSDFHLERGDTKYDAASVTISSDKGFFLTKLNPGTARTGILVFDVPASTAPSKYRLIVYGNGTSDHTTIQLR